ncbi:MAG TPA: hypothetical protein VG710_02690, partial [Opitutus sp.]|nr:hypothetical protein [Opitutus sp.]
LLQTLVTQSAKLAADSGDSTLLANVVAFAVANASADQKSAIIQAANNGVNSSSSTDKTNLNTLVADSADKGSTLGSTAAAPTTQQSVNGSGQTITTIITPLDPSQVLIISPST